MFNEAFSTMLGYDAETLKGMNFADFTHPDDLKLERAFFDEILAGTRNHYHITKRYIANHGRILWVDLSAAVIRDADGKVANFVAVIQDITERKEAEARIVYLNRVYADAERHQYADRARARPRRAVQGGVPDRGRGRRIPHGHDRASWIGAR